MARNEQKCPKMTMNGRIPERRNTPLVRTSGNAHHLVALTRALSWSAARALTIHHAPTRRTTTRHLRGHGERGKKIPELPSVTMPCGKIPCGEMLYDAKPRCATSSLKKPCFVRTGGGTPCGEIQRTSHAAPTGTAQARPGLAGGWL